MNELYRTPTRSGMTRQAAIAAAREPAKEKLVEAAPLPAAQPLSFEELFKRIQNFEALAQEIKKLEEEITSRHEEIKTISASIGTAAEFHLKHSQTQEHVNRLVYSFNAIKRGPPGEDGKDAIPPKVPSLKEIVYAVLPKIKIPKAKKGDPGEPGKHADPGSVVELIKSTKSLRAEHIRIGKTSLDEHLRLMDINAKRAGVRGGGDTVAQGSGILLTRNANGQVVITATGASLTPITVTGTINDTNKIFASVTQPTLLNINGSFYLPTGGNITWTWVAGTITLSSAVGTGGSIFGL